MVGDDNNKITISTRERLEQPQWLTTREEKQKNHEMQNRTNDSDDTVFEWKSERETGWKGRMFELNSAVDKVEWK